MLRNSLRLSALCAGLLLGANAMALSLGDLSQGDATGGLKDALTQGAQIAVKQLGAPGGFSNNPEVKIGLPGKLEKAAGALKMLGMGDQITQLEASMNKAAESAVTQAQPILVNAVKNMSVSDAKGILSGGQDSATQYLDKSSREQIRAKFLPIVKQSTDKVGVAQQYNALAKKAPMGLLGGKSDSVENYVTEQALDGLFKMIAQQEESIRQNPAAAATSLAKKVFGAL
ncbi:DUF4197 domain-containing protein [Pseudomonas sp. WS 5059]|jgi:hypothetical protein|uniref:DUF4197 domain-containing protein n=1 Tax=unclassified Pseudomonas TaxID=196821 RepID=UPI0014754847|nr:MULTISPECIES: DUF4197 domain-containing protein [unclassified Pseudomonas]NMX65001.1 DUF4197 domain-containing protein [Pseudomonas sp. WS 5079]NMX70063.1 DUF4197 domain-containing protein [Pseudomonas sp. WS 5111]NMX88951.1 DUF4197 domain-containing protein [Pseudomonas sp. WS 5010]NMY05050.1 DUF4197 domain-containing protein [Pseudomonas sp. WS 5059]NMY28703.1 DUF4197 domain-containing protein [Pseudomonas sp. WS 5021]